MPKKTEKIDMIEINENYVTQKLLGFNFIHGNCNYAAIAEELDKFSKSINCDEIIRKETMREQRGRTVEVKCQRCGCEFNARIADRKRGWGKFCSKSCKAIKQEKRTGQHASHLKYGASDSCGYMSPSMAEGEVQ